MRRLRFQQGDPWVLLSVAAAGFRCGCTLSQLIAAADYINHAIPDRAAIEGGVNRLARAGLLAASSGLFKLTPTARRLLLALEAEDRRTLRQWTMLGEKLPHLAPGPARPGGGA